MSLGADVKSEHPTIAGAAPLIAREGYCTWSVFLRQESALIALNLGVLATLVLIHVGFASIVGALSFRAYLLFCGRFAMQAGEWLALSAGAIRGTDRLARWYGVVSIIFNVIFAAVISIVSEVEHSHYIVLMLIPIIAAAFRLPVRGLAFTVLGASALAFLEVYLFYLQYPPAEVSEYFEAATVSLVYVVAGASARLLAKELRQHEIQLSTALRKLTEAQETLVRTERLAAIGRLSSALAHEIRNPVAMIAASLRRACEGTGARSPDELISIAGEEAAKLEKLTSDFLEYARGDRPTLHPYDLALVGSAVADLASASAEEAGVTLAFDAPSRPVEVLCDPNRMHRAVLNLARNAIEAAPRGDVVRIGIEVRGEDGVLSVSNPGGPISPGVADRLFEPFATTKPSGTGLGLSIAWSIVRAHDGSIVLAENTSHLVRFEVRIPLMRGA